ncbi:DUF1987 domain-containing protein [bacterium]|nr:DUF1987 domain-containing protein [bacterium]
MKLTLQETNDSIEVKWNGKSTDREPGVFISPILLNVLELSSRDNKDIRMDFRALEYMNSSTITPIIKILERAKRGTNKLTVIYDKTLKWQDLSFSALEIFQTQDKRVEIKGLT